MKIPILKLNFSEDDINFIKDRIESVIRSGFLTMGTNVKEFEKLFAKFCNTKYALGTNSGTSVLEIALRIIDVAGGSVVLPSNTYMATPLAAIKAGAKIIFTECERDNLQMDPDDLKRKVREDTKAVILVHIGGIISPRIKEIQKICRVNGIPLIEDAAHAHGAEYNGVKAGKFGLAAGFSFYPTKVLTTAEGGMLVTENSVFYEKGIVLREHGKADHNFNIHTEIGDNWRFSELHAVLGIVQMKKANKILESRRRIAKRYNELLNDFDKIHLPVIDELSRPSYHKYIVFLPNNISRDELKAKLKSKYGIALTGEVYSHPCHSQPVFQKYPKLKLNKLNEKFAITNYVCANHVCLPLYPGLNDEEIEYVVKSFKEVILKYAK